MKMKIGLFGDPHITKKIQEFSNEWETSVINTFTTMYNDFMESGVDIVICTGDFFDKAILEAKHVPLVNKVCSIMNIIPTFLLLGNHEIDTDDHNILEALDGYGDNIRPVTSLSVIGGIVFVPYNVDLDTVDPSIFKDKLVVTHHDIYGSEIAGGKVKASFGYDPNIFNQATRVFNGHIHLRSVLGKVTNIGSLFSTQFGEIRENSDDSPMYYIYEVESDRLTSFRNENSLYYITCDRSNLDTVINNIYEGKNLVLRLSYQDEASVESLDSYEFPDNVLKVSKKKLISSKDMKDSEIVKNSTSIDIREMISSYIDKDASIPEESKQRVKSKCLDLLN